MKIDLIIPKKLPSANVALNLHFRAKHKQSVEWHGLVALAINTQPESADVEAFKKLLGEHPHIRITVVARLKRLYDPDNLFCKWLIDGLKGILITDDNEEIVKDLVIKQEKIASNQYPDVLLTVEILNHFPELI